MADKLSLDSIYLNTRGSQVTNDWIYYRLRSVGGRDNDPIEVSKVSWPTFTDIDSLSDESNAIIWTPGITGMASAYPTLQALLSNKWGIDHEASTLIGFLERQL